MIYYQSVFLFIVKQQYKIMLRQYLNKKGDIQNFKKKNNVYKNFFKIVSLFYDRNSMSSSSRLVNNVAFHLHITVLIHAIWIK